MNVTLGDRIRELRLKKGLTQTELAKGVFTPSMLSQVESNKARPSHKILAVIADRLEVPLEKLLDDVDLNLEYASTYKMAKAMVAAKEFVTAIPLLEQSLETPRNTIPKHEIQFDLANCLLNTGQHDEAEKLLNQVQQRAMVNQDFHLVAQTSTALGQNEFNRKQYHVAMHHWTQAMEQVEKLEIGDVQLKAGILQHLGDVHERLGMVGDAVEFYLQASSLYQSVRSLDEVAKVYMELGQSYKRLDAFEKSAECSERAISLFESLENVYMSVKVQVNAAIVYGKSGREEEAIQMLRQSIRKLQELHKTDEVGMAYVELAKVQLATDDLDEAEVSCRIARSFLPELHVYQGWVNRVLGKVERHRGNQEEAIRRYQMAADCFKQYGEIGERESTLFEIAEMKMESEEYMDAYKLLSAARIESRQALEDRGIVL